MAASEKLKQAARENGKKGGRPATSLITQGEREIREEARKIGRSALKNVVQFWVDVMNGDIPGANCGDKLRARDFIEGLDILVSMRLCANVPAQHAIQTALGGYQSINDLVAPGGRLHEQRDRSGERNEEDEIEQMGVEEIHLEPRFRTRASDRPAAPMLPG